MIISRTPLRVSFSGGGTDLKAYYKYGKGAVTSTAINKYIYITVNKRFDDTIRVGYSKTEIVNDVSKIQHDLVRECMKFTGIEKGIEITSIADVPLRGTGLGSSSSFTVGLLNALYAFKGEFKSAERLAKEACKIEIDIVKEPIGKQDQYIVAYGGLQHIQFNSDESVFVDPIICSKAVKEELQQNLLMFYTGLVRRANSVLSEQTKNTPNKKDILDEMTRLAVELKESLNNNNLKDFGTILHKGWKFKKQLASSITNNLIEDIYEKAIKTGASGGKILGAGGGGFLLFYCEKEKQDKVRETLKDLKELPFSFEPEGSKIIYVGD